MEEVFVDIIKLNGAGFASNTYILTSANESAIVDPSADLSAMISAISENCIKYILLTHGHFDHIMSLDELEDATGAQILIHKGDLKMPGDTSINASDFFGIGISSTSEIKGLSDGDTIILGNESIKVISTPGHTPGSACFDCGDFIVCGDTLFSHGYGRYDLPEGNPKILFTSLKKLADIKGDPMIHPGHGASCLLSSADIIRAIRNNNFV